MLPAQETDSPETPPSTQEGLEIKNIAKAVKRVTPDPSPKLSEYEDKVNNLDFDKETPQKQKESEHQPKPKRTFTFGTLSNLSSLNFEEQSPIFKFKGGDTPTPSGIEECRLTIMKMLDESVSGRNYPLKSQQMIMKDSANSTKSSTIKESKKHETNFSFFLKKNALMNYHETSPKAKGEVTPEHPLTKPTEFIVNYNIEPEEPQFNGNNNTINLNNNNSNNSNNSGDNFNEIGGVNNTSSGNHNTFLNMNVNMNVVNPVNYFPSNEMGSNKGTKKKKNQNEFQNRQTQHFPPMGNPSQGNYQNSNTNNNFYNKNRRNQQQFNINDYYPPQPQPMEFPNPQMPTSFYPPQMYNPMAQSNNMYYPSGFKNIQPQPQQHFQNPNEYQMAMQMNQVKKKPKNNNIINFNSMSLGELIRNSNAISKDQSGCRFLQKRIEEQPEIANKILNNVFQNIIDIVTDPFGNYLIQKLFDYMNDEQFCQFLALVQIDIYKICINSYGTRVIQKIINYLRNDILLKTFLKLIKPIVKKIILDINGSHILIKIIDTKNPNATKVIYQEIAENIVPISMHKHGCCVLQKCIERAETKEQQQLFSLLLYNCKDLIIDQCGNYIIQFIITLNINEINVNVANQLSSDIENFSKQKYASNVVEKCLECGSDEICDLIIKALLKANCVVSLLFDKFGNYVVQKALQRADQATQQNMLNIIAPHLQKLKNFPFGMKLYSKLIITYSYLSMIILGKIDDAPKSGVNPLYQEDK